MKSDRTGVMTARSTGRQAAATLGLMRQARVWHLQDQNVGFVFEDAALSEFVDPDRALRRNLELARENARLAAEKAVLGRENEEQSEEIGQLMDIVSAFQDELAKTQEKLALVEAELADSRRAIAETTLRRGELQPFWALATAEARLLLVTAHVKGSVEVGEIVRQAGNNAEVLEAICRLRTVGFIKFQGGRICTTVTGESFAKRLGFVK